MRDAFISWDEEFVLDVSVRYWERARRAMMDFEGWHSDFRRVLACWMSLQRHPQGRGIFARPTLRDGKPKYLADTPRFIGCASAPPRTLPRAHAAAAFDRPTRRH